MLSDLKTRMRRVFLVRPKNRQYALLNRNYRSFAVSRSTGVKQSRKLDIINIDKARNTISEGKAVGDLQIPLFLMGMD